jgi:hypothetical protein
MSDTKQTETGADQNALRTNIPVGESRDYKVTAVHGTVVAAQVTDEPDFDADNCVFVPEGFRPAKGQMCKFSHVADDSADGSHLECAAL